MSEETPSALRTMAWPDIVERFKLQKDGSSTKMFSAAMNGIEQLAVVIADGPLSSKLFGWTAMFDLCIQQTDATPYSGPYLRVSPLDSGAVSFRYFDTAIPHRQWHREVPPEATTSRFKTFISQLNWVAPRRWKYDALIQRSDPNDPHDRVSVEAESLGDAKRLLEERFGKGKVVSITGERESSRAR